MDKILMEETATCKVRRIFSCGI